MAKILPSAATSGLAAGPLPCGSDLGAAAAL